MKKNFFKYTLLIEIVLLIIVSILISVVSDSLLDGITQGIIHGKNGYVANLFYLLMPVLLLLLSMLGALVWNSVVSSEQPLENRTDEGIRKQLRNRNFWKFSFFINALLTGAALIAFLLMYHNGLQEEYFSSGSNSNVLSYFFVVMAMLLIATFTAGGLLLGISAIWQTSKIASSLNAAVALIVVLAPFLVVSQLFFDDKYDPYLNEEDRGALAWPDSSAVSDATSYENENEHTEDGEAETDYLSSLWDSPGQDQTNVADVIRFVLSQNGIMDKIQSVDDVRFRATWQGTDDESSSQEEKNLFKINHYIDRDGEKLKRTYYSYQSILFGLLPASIYKASAAERMVDALAAAYYDIHSKGNEAEIWENIYDLMEDGSKGNAINYYDDIEGYISDDVIKIFTTKSNYNTENHKGDVVWAYSFWARRYKEGNINEVYDIVSSIQANYSEEYD